ncbi:UDP-N-acetylmuramoyl-tripeptide--D-alanyl-D-alanine ligase [Metabacillus endolithicus]|uniref:UDP-N-acetylmuramoyl-tripeptide--D-alanyl-D-alanine ligase n=1 Tax=Metabacillus endolithicus TaxID=1535204 RepID=A0ABW5C7W1_9BACI|nr:UDP-N-acetylmuramoyl-tripeptide--D-alanyl-D-alanine ligase [Metabacillus endolithicus]UPG61869.1 UDP-N-acetylmuramoyl-tripeptide--D-alanyl-D-alanine ligase [Metabacillus endolithicus]
MITRTLLDVQNMVNGEGLEEKYQHVEISGVTTDSRNVENDNLFFPLVGDVFNGHEFVDKAISNGAKAVIWQKSEKNPPKEVPIILVEDTLVALQALATAYINELPNLKIIGITGSNGKTTTKDMVAAILETTYKVHKTQGNFNNHIGLPLTVLSMSEDTEIAVLEMGMSGKGEIELLSEIAHPDVAVITNIGEAHLMDLGSREGIAEAKLEITKGLKKDGLFIFHGDEPLLQERVPGLSLKTTTFGEASSNDYYPAKIIQEPTGTLFEVNKEEYFIPVLGKHNVWNALAAYAVADYYGVEKDAIKKGFSSMKLTGMRLELIQAKNGASIINDAYNASPTSMLAAIDLIENLKDFDQKIVVLGDMLELGDDEVEYHQQVGREIKQNNISHIFTYGKLGKEIAKGAKENQSVDTVHHYDQKDELIKHLQSIVKEKDIVLVKASRGMKLEEVVNSIV